MTETTKYIAGEYKVLQQFGGAMGHVFLVEKQGIDTFSKTRHCINPNPASNWAPWTMTFKAISETQKY